MKERTLKIAAAVCRALPALLSAGFVVRLCLDYRRLYPYGSAPFWLYVLERGLEFLLPVALLLAAGRRMKKKTGDNGR